MMIIDLNKTREPSFEIDITVNAQELDLDSESITVVEAFSLKGEFSRDDDLCVVRGATAGKISADCDRCLEPVGMSLGFEFRSGFIRESDFDGEVEIELGKRDLDVSFLTSDVIDLSRIVREQIILAIPSRVLCSPECGGICQVCGGNLNQRECDCGKNEVDPRWSALKGLGRS